MKTKLSSISKSKLSYFVPFMMAVLISANLNAINYYAIANGNWNLNTTWSLSSGGPAVGVGIWPVAGDDVYISEGGTARSVSIPAGFAAACANIYMGAATGNAATLTFASSTASLDVSGNMILYGPASSAIRSTNVNAGTLNIAGSLELGTNQAGIQSDRVCRIVITTGTVSVGGDLVFRNVAGSNPSQTQITMSGAGKINLTGAFTINNSSGTMSPGTAGTFNFTGSASGQTVPVGVSNVVYNNLLLNNTHSSGATLSAQVTSTNVTGNITVQSGTMNNGGHAITLASGKNFILSDGTLFNLTGTSTMAAVSGGGTKTFGSSSTVNYAGSDQDVSSDTYGNLILSGSGTKSFLSGTTTVNGILSVEGTAVTAFTGSIAYGANATLQYKGTAPQVTGGEFPSTFDAAGGVVINNANGVTLDATKTISTMLTLTSGILTTTPSWTIIVGNTSASAITGASASNYVNGNLCRGIAGGTNSYHYPIGTAAVYAPVSFDFTAGTEAGLLAGHVTDGDHPDIITSNLSTIKTVNRYWTFSISGGLSTANYDATFNWVAGDQDAGFAYGSAECGKYAGGSWTYPAMGTLASTSAQITGVSGFSDFQVGNACSSFPAATISNDTTICKGSYASLRIDLAGTPDWSYTWSDGINTGTVSGVATSPAYLTVTPVVDKTYTITNVGDATGCHSSGTGSAEVTVQTGPVTTAADVLGCPGALVEVPVTVKGFSNVGAISMTMNYDKSVLSYDSYTDIYGMIDYVYNDETGAYGIVRFSGLSGTAYNLDDDDVLITLNFNYAGGSTDLVWDDTDDTWCEYASGAPDYVPYCDDPTNVYYINGSVSQDLTPVADFYADNLLPPQNTTIQLTDQSTGGVIGWEWSFDRPSVVFDNGTDQYSQNPQVHFTESCTYTVTLTVHNANCYDTEEKVAYIHVGTPGLWTGATSVDWNEPTNWDNCVLPFNLVDVVIPATAPNWPVYTGDLTIGVQCKSITLEDAASRLTVTGKLTLQP